MPITPPDSVTQKFANEDTPFKVTLTTAATEQLLVAVPATKKGRVVSLVNDGPGVVALAFDQAATTSSLNLKEGEGYADSNLEISTDLRFINVTAAQTPTVRVILWSGPA